MSHKDSDDFGNRLKQYERPSTSRRAANGFPLIVRLDGKKFSSFTHGMNRPYDESLSKAMVATMEHLVAKFHATAGYTQSDEITLCWYIPLESKSEYPFGGKFQKLESLLAAECSVHFNRIFPTSGQNLPIFDCRAFQVPNLMEAYHCFLWRQQDCTKNAISMAAQHYFSHTELHQKNSKEKCKMIDSIFGVKFDDFPDFFKLGTFARKILVMKDLSPQQLAQIPPELVPSGPVARKEIHVESCRLAEIKNATAYLFPPNSTTTVV